MSAVDLFAECQNTTGEGPLWSSREGALYWIDIGGKVLYRKSLDGAVRSWTLPDHPGCLGELDGESIAVAMGAGIQRLNLGSGDVEILWPATGKRPDTRFNDGKVDPQGRLWVSTMQNNFDANGKPRPIERRIGSLFRFDADGTSSAIEEDIGCGNSVAWSPDARRFYFADSLKNEIYVYDFDAESGAARNKRLFFAMANCGLPDGSAIDQDGCLWNARFAAGAILRITPDGKVDRRIEVPVPRPTSCAFGGPGLDILFVTSARGQLGPEALAAAPLSGSVFAIIGAGKGVAVPALAVNKTNHSENAS